IQSTQPHFISTQIKIRFPSLDILQNHWKTLFYQHFNSSYSSALDINATNSTWDELIELMYLRFIEKRSYAGTYRLFRTFVGTYQYKFIRPFHFSLLENCTKHLKIPL